MIETKDFKEDSLYLKVKIFKRRLISNFKSTNNQALERNNPKRLISPKIETKRILFRVTFLFRVTLTVKRIKTSKK